MTKETLQFFYDLLGKVSVNPIQQDAESLWSKIMTAKKEIENELKS